MSPHPPPVIVQFGILAAAFASLSFSAASGIAAEKTDTAILSSALASIAKGAADLKKAATVDHVSDLILQPQASAMEASLTAVSSIMVALIPGQHHAETASLERLPTEGISQPAAATAAIEVATAIGAAALGGGRPLTPLFISTISASDASTASYCGPGIIIGAVRVRIGEAHRTEGRLTLSSAMHPCFPSATARRKIQIPKAMIASQPRPSVFIEAAALGALTLPGGPLAGRSSVDIQLVQYGYSPLNESAGWDAALYSALSAAGESPDAEDESLAGISSKAASSRPRRLTASVDASLAAIDASLAAAAAAIQHAEVVADFLPERPLDSRVLSVNLLSSEAITRVSAALPENAPAHIVVPLRDVSLPNWDGFESIGVEIGNSDFYSPVYQLTCPSAVESSRLARGQRWPARAGNAAATVRVINSSSIDFHASLKTSLVGSLVVDSSLDDLAAGTAGVGEAPSAVRTQVSGWLVTLEADCGPGFGTRRFACGPGTEGLNITFSCPVVVPVPQCVVWNVSRGAWDPEGGCSVFASSPTAVTCACTRLSIELAVRFAGLEQRHADVFASNAAIRRTEMKRSSIAYFGVLSVFVVVATWAVYRGVATEARARSIFEVELYNSPEVAATRALLSEVDGSGDIMLVGGGDSGSVLRGSGYGYNWSSARVVPVGLLLKKQFIAGSLSVLLNGVGTGWTVLPQAIALRKRVQAGALAPSASHTEKDSFAIEMYGGWHDVLGGELRGERERRESEGVPVDGIRHLFRPFLPLLSAVYCFSPALSRAAHACIILASTLIGCISSSSMIAFFSGVKWPTAFSFTAVILAASLATSCSYAAIVFVWWAHFGKPQTAFLYGFVWQEMAARREAEAVLYSLSDSQLIAVAKSLADDDRELEGGVATVTESVLSIASNRIQDVGKVSKEPGPAAALCLALLSAWLIFAAYIRGASLATNTADATAIVLVISSLLSWAAIIPAAWAGLRMASRRSAAPAVLSASFAAAVAAASDGDIFDVWGCCCLIEDGAKVSERRRTLIGTIYVLALCRVGAVGTAEVEEIGAKGYADQYGVSATLRQQNWAGDEVTNEAGRPPLRAATVGPFI